MPRQPDAITESVFPKNASSYWSVFFLLQVGTFLGVDDGDRRTDGRGAVRRRVDTDGAAREHSKQRLAKFGH